MAGWRSIIHVAGGAEAGEDARGHDALLAAGDTADEGRAKDVAAEELACCGTADEGACVGARDDIEQEIRRECPLNRRC